MSKYAKSYEKMLYNTLIFIVVAGRIERQNLMASLALGGGGWGGKLLPPRLARHDFWSYHIGGQA